MKVLLLFLLLTMLLAIRGARRGKPARFWPVFIASVIVSAAFLSQRVI
jgi:hypothetical protein